jgi:hypothetical protein
MVPLLSLWLPILVAAVLVFVASSVIHMAFTYHNSEYRGLSNETAVADALRAGDARPGMYTLPYASGMKEMGAPEYVEKLTRGPVAFITLRRPGPPSMGPQLAGWFVWLVVVSAFVAFVASTVLDPGEEYLEVFHLTGLTAFLAYGLGHWPETIWWSRPVSASLKNTFDGLVYALLTAGAFGWLWPGM